MELDQPRNRGLKEKIPATAKEQGDSKNGATKEQHPPKGSVVEMQAKRKEKSIEGAKNGEIETMLLAAIQRSPHSEFALKVKFPYRWEWLAEENDGGGQIPIEITKDNVCKYLTTVKMGRIIRGFSQDQVAVGWRITPTILNSVIENWFGASGNDYQGFTEEIKAIAFKSDKTLTWNRLGFDPTPGDTPMFDEMMSRMSSPIEVMAWLGSLTDPKSDRSQFLWVHGSGSNGKSRLLAMLANVFGQAYSSQIPPERGDKFWTAGLLRKRIVAFPDCSNSSFVKSDLFKSLTGDRLHKIEAKGQMPTNMNIDCKFIFMSNTLPEIVGEEAGIRRALVSDMATVTGKQIWPEEYDRRLTAEVPGIFAKCLAKYRELCPEGGGVPVGHGMREHVQSIIEAGEEKWAELLYKNFVVTGDKRHSVRSGQIYDTVYQAGHRQDRLAGEFKRYLIKKGAILARVGANGERVFLGLERKELMPGNAGTGGGFC
jgi:hypothetical protein